MDKKLAMQIIVPIVMVMIIAGIWIVQKNNDKVSIYDDFEFPLVSDTIDLNELKSHKLPIIIDFGADACQPCKMMEPVLIKINANYQGRAIIKFIDIWKNPGAAREYPIQVIPTQLFINADGTPYIPTKAISNSIAFQKYYDKDSQKHIFTVHKGGLTEVQMKEILSDMGVK